MANNFPKAKSAVIVTTDDIEYGKQSAATYGAAFEVAGIKVLDTNFHGFDVTDFAPIVSSALAKNPDIFCMATDVYTTPLVEQLYHQGFKGKIISCTLDLYDEVIAKTSKEFVEGLIFQFPDYDDPLLESNDQVYFPNPRPAKFDAEFKKKHPGEWSAVAWEFPSNMQLWADAAEAAGSIEPMDVLKALKAKPPKHAYGPAHWWGKDLWGLDNASVGMWPVVTMQNGRARIVEFRDVHAWLKKNNDVLKKHMRALDLRTV
jgi:branched-chain amino acid transport system substrate-binding protein